MIQDGLTFNWIGFLSLYKFVKRYYVPPLIKKYGLVDRLNKDYQKFSYFSFNYVYRFKT